MISGDVSPLANEGKEANVAILGVSQTDYCLHVDTFPKDGETLLGTKYTKLPGGKGSNQSIMCSKLMETNEVVFISCVGDDEEGEFLKKNLTNIKTDFIFTLKNVNTTISQNIICKDIKTSILTHGANQELSEEHLDKSWEKVKSCKVFLCQLENKPELTLYGLKKAKKDGITTIFNPSPPIQGLSNDYFINSDIICLNKVEAEVITGIEVSSVENAYDAALEIVKKGSKSVIVTLGEKGSVFVDQTNKIYIPATKVKVIDASGVGECFIGSLAYFVASGVNIIDSISLSCYLASVSVQYVGTRASYPSRSNLF